MISTPVLVIFRCTCIINFLTDKALSWATAVWQGNNNINYELFITMFRNVFDHSYDSKEVSEKLLSLKQGNRRAAEYSLDFRTLAAKNGWNDTALQAVYRQGHNDEILKK